MEILLGGILLGGTYALIAMGLQLQYGVSRIMNLANGEVLVAGSFGAFWLFMGAQINPIIAIIILAPAAYALNWFIYKIFLLPLVNRSKTQGQLEVDSILATFGISFIFSICWNMHSVCWCFFCHINISIYLRKLKKSNLIIT